jgi:hypothetical protein
MRHMLFAFSVHAFRVDDWPLCVMRTVSERLCGQGTFPLPDLVQADSGNTRHVEAVKTVNVACGLHRLLLHLIHHNEVYGVQVTGRKKAVPRQLLAQNLQARVCSQLANVGNPSADRGNSVMSKRRASASCTMTRLLLLDGSDGVHRERGVPNATHQQVCALNMECMP